MKTILAFKVKTYLFAFFLILLLPLMVLGGIWYIYSPDILQGLAWLIGEYVFWASTLLLLPQLWGSDFREWLCFDTLKILKAFEQSTSRTLLGIVDRLPTTNQHISRKETTDALALLREEKHILISGESGSGKSGVAASIAKDAVQRGIPVLFLDTRQYSKSVQNLSDLGHEVNLEKPLLTCIEKVAKQVGTCLLMIDQLDSTMGTSASQASIELLAKASIIKKVQVVAVGYISKKPEYKPITQLGFTQVDSKAIERKIIQNVLHGIGIHTPSDVLLSITDNLFYLSIIVELASTREINKIDNEVRLLEEYFTELEAAEGGEFVQRALDLAYDQLNAGLINFPLPREKDIVTNRLIQRGLIIDVGNYQFHFRHEQLHFFLFAKQVAERAISLDTMLSRLKIKYLDTPLIFVLRYLYTNKHSTMEEFLSASFNKISRLRFYERAALVDEIISWQDIKFHEDKLSSFFSLVRKEPYATYFFRHLAAAKNTAWFPVLKDKGFFSPSYESLQSESQLQSPRWTALPYLVAIAPELPNDLLDVAQNLEIENAFDLSALVGSFVKIPADYAPDITPIVISWLNKGLSVSNELTALINHWEVNGHWQQALILTKEILTPDEMPVTEELRQYKHYSPHARFRDFNYLVEEYLKSIASLTEAPWLEILDILEEKLIQALEIEQKIEEYESSSYWRPSIEVSSQSVGDHCKDLLLDVIISILDKLAPEQKIPVVEKYISHSFSIFRRLAIYLIRTDKDLWSGNLVSLYTDKKYWDDIDYYHEFWLLTHDTFSALEASQQQVYVDRILAELDGETSDNDEKKRARHWIYRRLWAIKAHLSSAAKNVFEELRNEFGDPNPPDWFAFLAYSSDLEHDTESSKTSKELSEIALEEVLVELKKDFPSNRTGFHESTKEGLAMELENAVRENPVHFALIAPKLLDSGIHPLYVNHYIRGLSSAWREKLIFDWAPVIKLCDMISRTLETVSNSGTPADMEQDYWYNTYASPKKAITELFSVVTADDDHAIPHQYLDDVRDILIRLLEDPNPSLEYEQSRTREDSWNYLDLSINVTRSKAMASLIQYALHRSRIVKNDETAQSLLPEGRRIESQVVGGLTKLIDKKLDPSKSVHINFGIYLPHLNYLERKWLIAHIEEVFPRDPEMNEYWRVAWEGYMWRNSISASIYADLRPYYLYAVEQLKQMADKEAKNPEKRLANHLALLYAHGHESLENNDSLILHFFTLASDGLRRDFVRSLVPVKIPASLNASSVEWTRLKSFWQWRHAYIQKQEKSNNYTEELASFVSWIPHIPEPLRPFEEMIKASAAVASQWELSSLFEYLAKVVNKYPAFVMNLYEMSFNRTDLQYFFMTRPEEVQTILNTAIHSDSPDAQESAIRVINFFGERGDESYRDLLKEM